jgi:hypothetical protein
VQQYRSEIIMSVKTLTSLLVVLLVAIQFAGGDDSTEKPNTAGASLPWTFASIDEMKRWGESSAFGGGMVSEPYKLGEHTIYVVIRMHTSGMLTSELSIYVVNQDGKGVSLALFQPARYMGISTKLVDDSIVCESKDPETGKTMTTLTITRHLFDKKPFKQKWLPTTSSNP